MSAAELVSTASRVELKKIEKGEQTDERVARYLRLDSCLI